ncbi:tRNA-guanine transglycosylase DpdA [Paraliomyxa miuraensis]|uniref:tRNA-guanine transglycosylase DpdA n=1 Tax=Paraliomyxa miuraensis TaxID=376150 RepID=UPI00225676D0|nr:tRNA-guanine transglycosylase DpdA [Paraliomyxa miuraensis]MCX4247534.1 tRNA-guanine transglycosylase DpdA [Paraliomyxa miuraensis]
MKYFLPDAQDLVDPSFDFTRETRSPDRIRQRDDLYAHEVFRGSRAYDGILLSKGIVEAVGGGAGRYAQSQRLRLLREGAKDFFRLGPGPRTHRLQLMGDCGAFTYVKEPAPPFPVDDVIRFYEGCGFDFGISVDHIILDYRPDWDEKLFGKDGVPKEVRARQELTLELARDFLRAHKRGGHRFKPLGVAQGWSPKSYAHSVRALQKIGYDYIAVGGLVPLKTPALVEVVGSIAAARKPKTKLHLLGVTRVEHIGAFESHGVASFDSTSPLRQAFKDDKDNYYTLSRTYTALRVPQVQGNAKLERRIRAGEVDQDRARAAEQKCLRLLADFGARKPKATVKAVLAALQEYEAIHSPDRSRAEAYRETLEAAPWRECGCEVCEALGHHVILFRGAERNRRRGFHNVWVFYQRVQRGLGRDLQAINRARRTASPRQEAFA